MSGQTVEELRQTVEELRRELEARDAFLLAVSTGLSGCIERLAADGANVDEIRGFVRELAIIAGDMEARAPRRVAIDAREHVEATVAQWRRRTGGIQPIQIAIQNGTATENDAATIGSWDPALLDTMLGELVSNACKYGGGRPVTVRVESDPRAVRFVVEDEGRGIEEDGAARRFTRGRETSGIPGYGVGLWLVRLLAEAHGGTFRLVRRESTGTRAVVELPRA